MNFQFQVNLNRVNQEKIVKYDQYADYRCEILECKR